MRNSLRSNDLIEAHVLNLSCDGFCWPGPLVSVYIESDDYRLFGDRLSLVQDSINLAAKQGESREIFRLRITTLAGTSEGRP